MTMLQNLELLRSNLIKAVNSECDKMRSHTNATLLINNGTNIKAVQGLLGHSTAVTTMNIYAHEIQAAEAAASAALGEIIENDLIKKAE